jgi:hypothetical protein
MPLQVPFSSNFETAIPIGKSSPCWQVQARSFAEEALAKAESIFSTVACWGPFDIFLPLLGTYSTIYSFRDLKTLPNVFSLVQYGLFKEHI